MREGPLLKSLGRQGQIALAIFVAATMVMVPLLRLLPETSMLHPSDFTVTWLGKILCYMVLALALDLVWGLAGILSLGHGLFFALGGYGFGMYLMRSIGTDGVYKSHLPDFMVFLDWKEFPWFWTGTQHFLWAMALVVLVPGILAFVFGFFAFRSRIKGVYFSIITQALTYAAMLFFFRNETGFGGNNGFTDFKRILGFDITSGAMRTTLFVMSAGLLVASLLGSLWLARSRFGRILTAIRDAESRLQFCGYDTLWYKLSIWTLSAVIAGIAGALYVPQVGIINPSEMSAANSIEVAIWVAVGGRGTLVGPLLGAGLVNVGRSWLTANFPDLWLYALGGLFIFVTLFLPNGVVGLYASLRTRLGKTGSILVSAILVLDDITVSFDGFKALNQLYLAIDEGELRSIIGPNGAGKTTMMDVVTGKTRPDLGKQLFRQEIDLSRLREAEIAQIGIGRKFQKPTVFEKLTVHENFELAMRGPRDVWHALRAKLSGEQKDKVSSLVSTVGLVGEEHRIAGTLSHGQKQWLEIGMLLAQDPTILLLDEPVAGMTDAETEKTAELFLSLKGKHTLVVVEHDMDFIGRLGGMVTVMAEGRVLAEGTLDEVKADERVIEVYLGR